MIRAAAILLLMTCPALAKPPCNCTVQYKSPPTALQQCVAVSKNLLAQVEAYRDLAKYYQGRIAALEKELASDPLPEKVAPAAKAAPKRAKKARKVQRAKGCKKGRTRDKRGICGRWRK